MFSGRFEQELLERMRHDLLFRRFAGRGVDEPVWAKGARKSVHWTEWTDFRPGGASAQAEGMPVFSKIRDRLLMTVMSHREVAPLLSQDHFADADLDSECPAEGGVTPPEDDPGSPSGRGPSAQIKSA